MKKVQIKSQKFKSLEKIWKQSKNLHKIKMNKKPIFGFELHNTIYLHIPSDDH